MNKDFLVLSFSLFISFLLLVNSVQASSPPKSASTCLIEKPSDLGLPTIDSKKPIPDHASSISTISSCLNLDLEEFDGSDMEAKRIKQQAVLLMIYDAVSDQIEMLEKHDKANSEDAMSLSNSFRTQLISASSKILNGYRKVDLNMPDMFTTDATKKNFVVTDHSGFLKAISLYLKLDYEDSNRRKSETKRQKKKIILTDIHRTITERITALVPFKKGKTQNAEEQHDKLESQLKDVNAELLKLYQETDVSSYVSVSAVTDDQSIRNCQVGLPRLVHGDKDVISLMDKYLSDCREGFKAAVQKNDKDALEGLRESVSRSIDRINDGINVWVLDEIISDRATRYRKGEFVISELEFLSGVDSRLPLIANWQNQPFTFQFYLGADINKVSNEDTSESPRVGVQVYFRPGRQLDSIRDVVPHCSDLKKPCGEWAFPWWPTYFPHAFLTMKNTSSAEQSDQETKDVADWEAGLFFPMYIGRRGSDSELMSEFMFGPLWLRGARDIDGAQGTLDRKYWGARLAFNEEMYFDLLQGDSDGLSTKRYALRGQFPVSELGSGRLFFGYDINFSSFGKNSDNENDSTNLYLIWQTSFDDLWNVGSLN